ncbi:scavenger receptor cysteine-rich domain superfamily protein-like, partial [Patella vulgata]|uniref:scavenger receptor cysteine-rich domain superfamily protein-like n=1 Tax=Patella vulgata TaxID=6465 RepID=UPI0024A95F91
MFITIAFIYLLVYTVRTASQQIRLVGGSVPHEGRVEVFHNGIWGTVCDDGWDDIDASVVCRQLGFSPTGAVALPDASFGRGTGQIWLAAVNCQASNMALAECSHSGWGNEDCGHGEDASVICQVVTLVGGSNSMEGRVMVWHNGSFGRVCPDGFGQKEAHVVCRQLGFNNNEGVDPDINVDFGKGSSPILVSNINCKGNESSLSNCKHPDFRIGECSGAPDASVVCKFVPLRLVNGSGSHEGRVEVFDRRKWKTVCDVWWDDKEASVVCRQLGYSGTGAISKGRAYFGEGRGNIVIGLGCNGREEYLTDCKYSSVGGCSHTRDVSVICNDVTLIGGSNAMEGRVMVWHNGSFKGVCRDGFGQEEARVACRNLGFNNDGGDPDINVDFGKGSGPVLVSNINCKGNELSLSACKHPAFRFGECGCTPDFSVVCKFVPLRLVNGSGPHEGRVEVFDKREWKTVCDYGWDDKEASVVCRQLGYNGTGAISKRRAYFGEGRGNKVTWVRCNGREEYFTDC